MLTLQTWQLQQALQASPVVFCQQGSLGCLEAPVRT